MTGASALSGIKRNGNMTLYPPCDIQVVYIGPENAAVADYFQDQRPVNQLFSGIRRTLLPYRPHPTDSSLLAMPTLTSSHIGLERRNAIHMGCADG
jgi:hypothetical protein